MASWLWQPVAEFTTSDSLSIPTVSDNLTVTDVATVRMLVSPTAEDAITAGELATVYWPILLGTLADSVTVTEDVTILITGEPFFIPPVDDSIVISEHVSLAFLESYLAISTSHSITVNESVSLAGISTTRAHIRESSGFRRRRTMKR